MTSNDCGTCAECGAPRYLDDHELICSSDECGFGEAEDTLDIWALLEQDAPAGGEAVQDLREYVREYVEHDDGG